MIRATLAVLMIALVVCLGCTETQKMTAPQSRYRVESDGRRTLWEVSAVGPSVTGDAIKSIRTGAVSASPDGANTAGMKFKGLGRLSSMVPLYIFGGLAVLAGLGLGRWIGWGAGFTIAGAGIALIAAVRLMDAYPWVLLIPVALAMAFVVYVLYALARGKSLKQALSAVASAVEECGDVTKHEVEARVAKKSSAGAELTKAKKAAGYSV